MAKKTIFTNQNHISICTGCEDITRCSLSGRHIGF